jgi:hypothetical protein
LSTKIGLLTYILEPLDFTNGFEVKFILMEELDVQFEDEVKNKKILEIAKKIV